MSDKRACSNEDGHPSHPHSWMLNRPLRPAWGIELVAALIISLSAPALAADGVRINDLVVATPIPDAQRDATIKAVRAFYDFWNTGDEALLKDSIASNFTRSEE